MEIEIFQSEKFSGNEIAYNQRLVLPCGDPADFGNWHSVQVELLDSFINIKNAPQGVRNLVVKASYFPDNGLLGCNANRTNWVAIDSIKLSTSHCRRHGNCFV